jgi:sucrose-6-phosphate hydrolase SacC (GH32 family)
MPVSELDYYFKRVYSVDNISDINDPVKDYIKDFKEKKGGRIKFKISNSEKENIIHLCKNEDNRISIYLNKSKLFIEKKSELEYLKRELELTEKMKETLEFDILIDNSLIEIFINNGEISFTSRLFFEYNSIIDFETINGIISDIEIYYN